MEEEQVYGPVVTLHEIVLRIIEGESAFNTADTPKTTLCKTLITQLGRTPTTIEGRRCSQGDRVAVTTVGRKSLLMETD